MEYKQTAVEWLVRKVSNELIGEIPLHRWDEIRDVVQQAKEMEKEQIVDAHNEGFNDGYNDAKSGFEPIFEDAEQYYDETYGK